MKPVEARNLSYSAGETVILEDISLDVEPGEFVGLIGPNGGGKTTLLQVLLGMITGWTGQVRVYGRDPRQLGDSRNLIASVAQVSSQSGDFPATARDAVLMGRVGVRGLWRRLSAADRAAADEMLDAVGMTAHADRLVGDLSGGQRQRVFIARALAAKPKLLILDEPMTGVDRAGEEAFFDLLVKLKRELGLTIIMASHDLTTVSQHCDTVACISRRMHCHTPPSQLDYAQISALFGRHLQFFIHADVPHRVVPGHGEDAEGAPRQEKPDGDVGAPGGPAAAGKGAQ